MVGHSLQDVVADRREQADERVKVKRERRTDSDSPVPRRQIF